MTYEIRKVKTPADLNQFIRLPWELYGDNHCWVPPLISERKRFLNPKLNPFFEHAEVELCLAHSENRTPVGRIACILNHAYNTFHSKRTAFFGMFESVNQGEASDLLLDWAFKWCREKDLDQLVGPMNLSTNHECGLLVDGFDTPPMIGIPYNPPYYHDLFEQWGLTKAKDILSLKIEVTGIPEYLSSAISRLKRRNRFSVRPLRLDRFKKEVDIMWDVYNSSWGANWGFVPMSRQEFVFSFYEVKPFIQPEYLLIAEIEDEPVGFSLILPNINQVLKKINGSLFPFGWASFLWNKNKINSYRVVALGVKRKYRCLGIDAYFYHEIYRQMLARHIPWVDMSWVLEDNNAMLTPIHRIGGKVYKRHRLYERNCVS